LTFQKKICILARGKQEDVLGSESAAPFGRLARAAVFRICQSARLKDTNHFGRQVHFELQQGSEETQGLSSPELINFVDVIALLRISRVVAIPPAF